MKKFNEDKIARGTGILIFGLTGPEPKASLLDEDGHVTSCPRGLSHPDIGVTLSMPHLMTPTDGGPPRTLESGTSGLVLGPGYLSVFRVYGQGHAYEDYTTPSLQGTVADDDAVILTDRETGQSWINVSHEGPAWTWGA